MSPEQGQALVGLARAAIERLLGRPVPVASEEPWQREPRATFVTLMRGERLRGCIGSIEPRRGIRQDVEENAVAAAARDPRFLPVSADELLDLSVEVTVLSALEPLGASNEDDAVAKLRPGLDGLVFESGFHRATFIPQMWEHLSDPREFLHALKKKAGVATHFWGPEVRLQRFTAEKWK